MQKNVYLWYSGATDVTGTALAEKLDIEAGSTEPKKADLVIGWGAKTKDAVKFPAGTKTMNHPDKIRDNRNKFKTLQALEEAKVPVAPFIEADKVLAALKAKNKVIVLPLVGRTKYHQSGKGFWLCVTASQVSEAIKQGAQYFQNYIDIKDEFRIHIIDGALVYTQKKVQRDNTEKAFTEQHAEKIGKLAEKKGEQLDKKTMDFVLQRVAKESPHPDMVIRSNRRGWKFSRLTKTDKNLQEVAIAALKAVGLEFGAVDCCVDTDGKPWVIEINSGPGLEASSFDAYVKIFKTKIKEILGGEKKATPTKKTPNLSKKTETKSRLGSGSAKERLTGLAEMLSLVEEADEDEAKVIERLVKRKLGG